MTEKCAWCGRITEKREDSLTSHGICPECKKIFLENRKELEATLRKIRSPQNSDSSRKDDSENGENNTKTGFII